MNWAWATSFDQLWHSPTLPMWVTLAAAIFFALVLLITLLRAERSVANGALTVITLLAIAIAVAATVRSFGGADVTADTHAPRPVASLPALSCLDDLAGDAVATACERALFAAADSSAAAVSYTAAQVTRLASFGDQAAADKAMSPELSALRRAVERDRYGLVAHVLTSRDGCTPSDCALYKSLSDRSQITANMTDKTYENLIGRYALSWNAPSAPAATGMGLASLPPSVPTGKPMSGDFPSSSSIPPVSIMTPEPSASAPPPRPAAPAAAAKQAAPAAAPRPAAPPPGSAQAAVPRTATAVPAPASAPPPAAKKQAPKKNAAAPPQQAAPVPLAPAAASEDN